MDKKQVRIGARRTGSAASRPGGFGALPIAGPTRLVSVLRRQATQLRNWIGAAAHALAVVLVLGATTALSSASAAPLVVIADGSLRGASEGRVDKFFGIPYANPPIAGLRWKPPTPASAWRGERDSTAPASSCAQGETPFGVASVSEDCLYLNVFAPMGGRGDRHPVLVWVHGGGLSLGEGHDYDATELAAAGTVVVTINYRLGALGFLAHPALADSADGSAGNYGWMDQQAALRWVKRNIKEFGGDPQNVTIAGQSAGGLSVLAQLASPGARGLFHRAIVQSGAFALAQINLADAKAAGQVFAGKAGCANQAAECLRSLPVATLLANQDFAYIPGVVDGKVLKEPIGLSLASGRFARVPIMSGTTHDEERLFVSLGASVSNGRLLPLQGAPVTESNYPSIVASTLSVSEKVADEIVGRYPPNQFPNATLAFSAAVTDAGFSCSALRANKWTSKYVPTYVYEFNDADAPQRYLPAGFPYGATHQSELQYLFALPTAPVKGTLSAEQQALAAIMQGYWSRFASAGSPSSRDRPSWPRFETKGHQVLSLTTPWPQAEGGFGRRHHCDLWDRVEVNARGLSGN
jgi:para-nitrobenzyl esterase